MKKKTFNFEQCKGKSTVNYSIRTLCFVHCVGIYHRSHSQHLGMTILASTEARGP